jgi:hypothetical protein
MVVTVVTDRANLPGVLVPLRGLISTAAIAYPLQPCLPGRLSSGIFVSLGHCITFRFVTEIALAVAVIMVVLVPISTGSGTTAAEMLSFLPPALCATPTMFGTGRVHKPVGTTMTCRATVVTVTNFVLAISSNENELLLHLDWPNHVSQRGPRRARRTQQRWGGICPSR